MAMGVDRRWRGSGRRGGRHPWGVAGRFDAGVVAERGIGAAQHGDCPKQGAARRTGPTRREDRVRGLRRAFMRPCSHESRKGLQKLERAMVLEERRFAAGDSKRLLIAGDYR